MSRAEGLWLMSGKGVIVLRKEWRAEVGPRMQGVRPATGSFLPERVRHSFECFVFAEVRDDQAERIDGNELVGDVGLEDENEIGRVQRTP